MTGLTFDYLAITVTGRPAPQGSKKLGEHGQLLEQSPYLPAWRVAVRRDTYRAYKALGIEPADLPLFIGPVGIKITFRLDTGQRIDSAPDLDKLLRSTWDALTKARVWEDDGRAVSVVADKRAIVDGESTGADIEVWCADVSTPCACPDSVRSRIGTCPRRGDSEYGRCPQQRAATTTN